MSSHSENAKRLLDLQKKVLEAIATDKPLQIVLDMMVLGIEGLNKNMRASILTIDRKEGRVWHVSSPSLPITYSQGIKMPPIQNSECCLSQ